MDSEQEENHWVKEVTLMVQEMMMNHFRYQEQNNPASSRLALAQAVLLNQMLGMLMQSDEWSGFKETVYDYIDSETERYREAREAGDRDLATIMLARVRCAKTLARRLENPLRQLLLASTPQGDTKPLETRSEGPYAELIKKGELGRDELMAFEIGNPKGLVTQHRLIAHELKIITKETADNLERVQSLGAAAKICLVSGRAQSCRYFMKNWLRLDNGALFKDFLREFIEEAELYYRLAQENDDREAALAILGRIGTARTLLRRLADPIRNRGFLSRITASVTLH
ncbi:MAG: hypothetical protein A2075_14670 [Geobacteraceae bacterium GWC2_58_44]|nr:MAG: hypothetical protein A2075_14670 [Geobacteraceae bacterium GWC2_58_44]HBG08047.1 hypothetical protein [Geobacter sp.]